MGGDRDPGRHDVVETAVFSAFERPRRQVRRAKQTGEFGGVGIVCHRFRFIFFPVPKAASSSVKKLIAQMEGLPSEGHPHHDIDFHLVWGKDLYKYPDYRTFTDASAARDHVRSVGAPVVVKASGLAAGKGAVVCPSVDDALSAVDAASQILFEEAMNDA